MKAITIMMMTLIPIIITVILLMMMKMMMMMMVTKAVCLASGAPRAISMSGGPRGWNVETTGDDGSRNMAAVVPGCYISWS